MDDESRDNSEATPISFERALDILEQGEIGPERGMMRWSSNYSFLVTATHDEMTVMGVYKPQNGERPLWDFPDGTLCHREVATFLTAQELGWQLVPPTVLRHGPRGLGSIQFFIDHDPHVNYFSFDASMIPPLMQMAAFDHLINNADRKGGHCLLDASEHLWGIDHGLTFHRGGKLRTVIWDFAGQSVPDSLLEDMEKLYQSIADPDSEFRRKMCGLLSDSEVWAFQRRAEYLLETKRYPKPGPGPNYPWPPV